MASYIENLHPMLYGSLLVTTEIAFIVGAMLHVYIIAVNVIEWRRGRAMSTSDQVIISIMVTRMILHSSIQLRIFWNLLCALCSPIWDLVIRITDLSAVYSSIWLSSLLCVVFYLKISNSHSVLFLQMRKIFSKRVLHFIAAPPLVSISQTIVIYFIEDIYKVPENSTGHYVHVKTPASTAVFFINLFGPLLIFLFSSLFLITSLYLHIRRMRCNRTGTGSLEPYYRIIKYTVGSLFTCLFCVIISILGDVYYYMFSFLLFCFPWTFFETLHSMLLIYATPKLKSPFSRILWYLSNCCKREEPRDLAMTVEGVNKL